MTAGRTRKFRSQLEEGYRGRWRSGSGTAQPYGVERAHHLRQI